MSFLDDVNEVAAKKLIPGITDHIFMRSPFLSTMNGQRRVRVLQMVRAIARRYNKRVKMWHKRGTEAW